jgi:hypothetical protein
MLISRTTVEDPEMAQRTTRSRSRWLLNSTLNRVTSQIARSGHGPFSLIRHVGRKSGRTYETPVILAKVPDGFIAELTYGDNVNCYRNVVAGGGCVVVQRRVEYRVTAIERCSAERGRGAYPPPFRVVLKAARRNDFRLLRTDHLQPDPMRDTTAVHRRGSSHRPAATRKGPSDDPRSGSADAGV